MAVCLVTGGAGFIGSHLVEALVVRGDHVRVLDDLSSGRLENLAGVMSQIEFVRGDIKDSAGVQAAVTGVDYIFHLAGLVSVSRSMEEPLEAELQNAVGTLNLLVAAKEGGVRRVIFSSTCAVYGDEPTLPKTETSLIRPKSPYTVSKLAAEAYCRLFNEAFGVETVVLRYFNVFGPRQDPSSVYSGVISIFTDKLLQGTAPFIYGDGEQTRDFVYVGDVVQANLLAMQTPDATGQTFNIGTGHPISINQLFETARRLVGSHLEANYQPPRPGDIVHSFTDPALARSVLGWSAQVQFEDGLKQVVECAKNYPNGPLTNR